MERTFYLPLLDRALQFAAKHTDEQGRMVVDAEIDCKDSGWLVLGGVIRGVGAGWAIGKTDLRNCCRLWTLASVRVDDRRSAWTTFALLYAVFLSGGPEGAFASLFSESEWREIVRFIRQLDMRYLREASRNYCVAAALIEVMRVRFGFIGQTEIDPGHCMERMLEAYLGNGFFNDDDSRGSRDDRRIDAYSGEIIGLLLHYDELFDFRSPFHERIMKILKDFCASGRFLLNGEGELAKWGRSLRGEAEIKKVFLWEFAADRKLIEPEEADAAAEKMTSFFLQHGFSAEGQVFRDKGGNRGIWDEYTTHVQAQGYGIYGLAMAFRFASGAGHGKFLFPSERESFLQYLPGSGIVCANSVSTGVHYVIPLKNRMTKNMFFWHNRITGENDVTVDVSTKFMPVPYFGRLIPAPYSGSEPPFLPELCLDGGERLVPRNLEVSDEVPEIREREIRCRQRFHFCRCAEYEPAADFYADALLICRCDGLRYEFCFSGTPPEKSRLAFPFFLPPDPALALEIRFDGVEAEWCSSVGGASVYGPSTQRKTAFVSFGSFIGYDVRWKHV